MVVDMGYWTKVGKRLLVLTFSIIGIYLAFKLAVFFMPFLIAFIISLMVEPIIRFTMKRTKLTRKTSAIIVLIIVFSIIIGLLVVLNPISLVQLCSYYVDGFLFNYLFILINLCHTALGASDNSLFLNEEA